MPKNYHQTQFLQHWILFLYTPLFRDAKSIHIFKKTIVTEKRKTPFFSVYDPLGVKLLTRLRLQFSHLNEHKFRHDFGVTVSPMCGSNAEIEDIEHFHFYSIPRFELFNNI